MSARLPGTADSRNALFPPRTLAEPNASTSARPISRRRFAAMAGMEAPYRIGVAQFQVNTSSREDSLLDQSTRMPGCHTHKSMSLSRRTFVLLW